MPGLLQEVEIYKVEPYVVSSDIYALAPHIGRGGWTWFTGSAAWMYRLIVESLLGLTLKNGKLSISACLPASWKEIKIPTGTGKRFTISSSVRPPEKRLVMTLDGLIMPDAEMLLVDDRREHTLEVIIPLVPDEI